MCGTCADYKYGNVLAPMTTTYRVLINTTKIAHLLLP